MSIPKKKRGKNISRTTIDGRTVKRRLDTLRGSSYSTPMSQATAGSALVISEVVEQYGVSEWQLRYWDATGILVPSRVGNRRVYYREHLEQLAHIKSLMSEHGYRPGEIRLLYQHQQLLDKKSVSKTKLLAEVMAVAKRGETIKEPYDPANPSDYNTTYRRLERIAKRLGRDVQIRTSEDGKHLEAIVKG